MVHKPPEPKGAAQGRGFFMAINSSTVVYLLYSPLRSLFLLVNTHGSFHCKQAMLLVNI